MLTVEIAVTAVKTVGFTDTLELADTSDTTDTADTNGTADTAVAAWASITSEFEGTANFLDVVTASTHSYQYWF